MKNYAVYIRVSTQKQGRSGLGLESQQQICNDFISANNGYKIAEFKDVESGTHRNRSGLLSAIEFCKTNNCGLVIAKLDRLARDVEFCFKVINTGIEIHFCDMPQINTLLLGVFASVAQYERELTSDRTKKALAAKKARGEKVGGQSAAWAQSWANKEQEQKDKEAMERGKCRRERHQQSRDMIAFAKVVRKTFPDECKSDDVCKWNWDRINCRRPHLEKMLGLMADFHDIDRAIFSKWNFGLEIDENAQRLRSYMQAFKKSHKI